MDGSGLAGVPKADRSKIAPCVTRQGPWRHDTTMDDLPAPLGWLVDEASASPGPDRFLAELGGRLLAEGAPLAGGALTLAVPHPIIIRRTWLWRAENAAVIGALSFAARLALCTKTLSDRRRTTRCWGWAGTRPFASAETSRLRRTARIVAAPLAALAARATLAALLEAYLGPRSAAMVQAGALRRGTGETIRLLYADLRGFTALSESNSPSVVISALDVWFDRIAGSVHAFGGEVLKFIGHGVLAIFPVVGGATRSACDAALRAVSAARIGMAHLDEQRLRQGLPALPFGAGAISARRIVSISPPSAQPSIWSAGWRGCANRCARQSLCPARLPPRRSCRWSRLERMRSAVSLRHAWSSPCRKIEPALF